MSEPVVDAGTARATKPWPAGRTIGAFSDYAGMLVAIRARVRELQIAGQDFDILAGLPNGYLSKLTGEHPVRRIGMTSMGPLFDALGVYCVVVEDPQATEALKQRIRPRNRSFVRAVRTVHVLTDRKWLRIQKLGRQARWSRMTKEQRAEHARALNVYRWRRQKDEPRPR